MRGRYGSAFRYGSVAAKREMRREARHGGREDDEVGHVLGATHAETEQVADMTVKRATRTGVEKYSETNGDLARTTTLEGGCRGVGSVGPGGE